MERLYDIDSYIKEFSAKVISCDETENGFKCVLDRTAFFPEQGGQKGDTGKIGDVGVFDTQIESGVVYHYTKEFIEPWKEYFCTLNWEERFLKMQIHTAEHIFSGVAHRLFGCENTGFHLDNTVTVDFDILLSEEQLMVLEYETNKAIWANKAIKTYFPEESELSKIPYRSKKEVYDGKVRIVEIEDVDFCACCAPHLKSTGEAGLFKILWWMKHKGGIRIFVAAGEMAYSDYRNKWENVRMVSNLLSVPPENVAEGVKKLNNAYSEIKRELAEKNNILAEQFVNSLPYKDGNHCVLFEELNSNALINLVNMGMEKCSGMFVLCFQTENALRYIIGSNSLDMGEKAKEINAALNGKGGGRGAMIQGSFSASFEDVKKYFERNDI
ncbi:MAG: alanyl-tRNA editing protein [Clostridia bacterium]|nr:alanyl-tRNA editing protein [Clostridia bacterium]